MFYITKTYFIFPLNISNNKGKDSFCNVKTKNTIVIMNLTVFYYYNDFVIVT